LRTLNEQDIEDLLVGTKIMGAGGPGPERVRPVIEDVLSKGKKFRLIRREDLPRDERAVIMGTIGGGLTKEQAKNVIGLPRIKEPPELVAFRMLGKYLGKEPYAVFSTELGAGNVPLAMCIAATLDKFTIDCDASGRGKPELSISTTNVAGVPLTPACLVTPFGDVLYLDHVLNDVRAEQMLRSVSIASGGLCGLCRCPLDRETLIRATIPETISWCIAIGSAIRRASDPVEAALKSTGGVKLFEGKVSFFERDERDAFVWGKISVDGARGYSGMRLDVWYKNENMVTWLDGKPYATCPDAICIIDAETGLGLSNWGDEFAKGRRVVVFGVPAYKAWRTKRGLEIFGPKHFGFDLKHVPVEKVALRT
jgi:uncharacterized protein